MRTLHVRAKYLFEYNETDEYIPVYVKEEANEEIIQLHRKRDGWKAKALRLIDFLNKKDKVVERLKKALEYYADEEQYILDNRLHPKVMVDWGKVARKALKEGQYNVE